MCSPLSRRHLYEHLSERICEEVPPLIELRREGSYWDFKRQWHDDNVSLQHDILCLANNLESEISYLIIGVDDKDFSLWDVEMNEDAKRRTNQGVVDMIGKMGWQNQQPPFLFVEPISYHDVTLDVLAIHSRREDMPYCLSRPSGKLHPWTIYMRRGDQNSPIDKGAGWGDVQDLWRHHFHLDESPLVRSRLMLADKEHWTLLSTIDSTDDKYYDFAPEFTIHHEIDDDRNAYEYYMLSQTDSRPGWYDIRLCYYQTVIYDTVGIALDGGRYFAPAPSRSFIDWDGLSAGMLPDLTFCYYTKDSLDWALNIFFYDETSSEATQSRCRFLNEVLLFEDDSERKSFEACLRNNKDKFDKRLDVVKQPYGVERLPPDYSDAGKEDLALSMRAMPVLHAMLDDYRSGKISIYPAIHTSTDW